MDEQETTITVRELREMLFHIDNQDMTVRQLRKALYDIDDQDAELTPCFAMWKKLGVE